MPPRRPGIHLAPVPLLFAAAVAFAPGLIGCASSPGKYDVSPPQAVVQAMSSRPTGEVTRSVSDSLPAALAKSSGAVAPPKNALLLSGGGQYAAYNTGVLLGWSHTRTRPTFDVVTGISSGAIVAAYAFLGEKYDAPLQQFFTTVQNKDLFEYRPLRVFRTGALADPSKLAALVDREVNDCFLFDLREAHKEGRRLYVGTMNVRTRRLAVWDLGAIACSDRPDAAVLVKKIIIATGSIPGLLPAVRFDVDVDGVTYTEEHCDGGAACQTFLRLPPGAERPAAGATGWLKGSNLYAMAAGKLYAPELTGSLGVVKRVGSTISAALYALYRAEVVGLYAFCGVSGMDFNMLAVPEAAEIPANSMTFEPAEMRKLFKLGYDSAVAGIPWRKTPPGAEPGEEEQPRDIPVFVPGGSK